MSAFNNTHSSFSSSEVKRFRSSETYFFPAGDSVLIYSSEADKTYVLPRISAEFLSSCSTFKSLATHLDSYAAPLDLSSSQKQSLRNWAAEFISSQVLVDQILTSQAQQSDVNDSQKSSISSVCFPTRNRPTTLCRGLTSFAENAQLYGRKNLDYIISDNSEAPATREEYKTLLRSIKEKLQIPILYIGQEEKQKFVRRLIQEIKCKPDVINFAFLNENAAVPSFGVCRNNLLVQNFGKKFISIDDDMICHCVTFPEKQSNIKLFSDCDPNERWFYPSKETMMAAHEPVQVDFVGLHEKWLGKTIKNSFENSALAGYDCEDANITFLRRLKTGLGKIRMTSFGYFGDPGFPNTHWYLGLQNKSYHRMVESESSYETTLQKRYSLWLPPTYSIGNGSACMAGAMGLDQTELLPPNFPIFRGEDSIFGQVLGRCFNDTFFAHFPYSVLHDPAEKRKSNTSLFKNKGAKLEEFCQIFRICLMGENSISPISSKESLDSLGKKLIWLGELSIEDFAGFLRFHIARQKASEIEYFENYLLVLSDPPDYFVRDVKQYIEELKRTLDTNDFHIPGELEGSSTTDSPIVFMQKIIKNYGELLRLWPTIVETSLDLQHKGHSLAAAL
jgi:hypothetical protein